MREGFTVTVVEGHDEADEVEHEQYRRMSPDERLDVLLDLVNFAERTYLGAPERRRPRTCRVTERAPR